jgi:dihydrofolate synthase/folylpolyglutamate synthase
MEVVDGDPVLVLDAAHNPAGGAALAEALPGVAGGRPVIAALALLADKDAAGVVGALAPFVAGVVATEIPADRLVEVGRPGARALEASRLAEVAREAGVGWLEEVADPAEAVARARSVARAQGGVALVAGSHYLLRYATYE